MITVKSTHSLSLILILALARPLAAQVAETTPAVPAADPADVESVDAIIAATYDVISGAAGEARDWDRFRSLFRPGAKIIPSGMRPDTTLFIAFWSPDEYIQRAGAGLEANGFFEVEVNRVQEQFGQIVHLFSTYESRKNADDVKPFQRGINSFQLVNDGQRWWVVNIFFQGESPSSPIPERYLPKM